MGGLFKGVKNWEACELRYLEEVEVKLGDALQEREGGRGQVGLQALQRRRRQGRRRLGAAALQEEAVQHRRRATSSVARSVVPRPVGSLLPTPPHLKPTITHTTTYKKKDYNWD